MDDFKKKKSKAFEDQASSLEVLSAFFWEITNKENEIC